MNVRGLPSIAKPLRIALCVAAGVVILQACAQSGEHPVLQETPKAEDDREEAIAYEKLKNPVPFSKSSIKRGRLLYGGYCDECHGVYGRSLVCMYNHATNISYPDL